MPDQLRPLSKPDRQDGFHHRRRVPVSALKSSRRFAAQGARVGFVDLDADGAQAH